ncbi:MAG: FecR domain-containing protein [Cyclobacteriaceae bacterium]
MKELKDAEWLMLLKAVKGEYEGEELTSFKNWLNQHPDHAEIYKRVQKDWDKSGNISIDNHPNPEAIWTHISNEIRPKAKVVRMGSTWLKYAAAIALLVTIGVFYLQKNSVQEKVKITAYENSAEDQSFIELSDGSKIWLDKNSSLGYSNFENSKSRFVTLKGKAYFEIARDESKPFIIESGSSQVKVLGTAFNLDSHKPTEEISVMVTHGKVSFTSGGQEVILTKGEIGKLDILKGKITETLNDDLNILAWKTGILTFEDMDISEVCQVLSKHYDMTVRLESGSKARLTASFDNQPIEEVAAIIAETLDLHTERKEGALIFK